MNPQTPFEWLQGYCERIGIPFRNIHSSRHLHASLLIFEGVDVVAVSADMGHSVVGTTQIYIPIMFQEARARNCDAISNALSFTNEVKVKEEKHSRTAQRAPAKMRTSRKKNSSDKFSGHKTTAGRKPCRYIEHSQEVVESGYFQNKMADKWLRRF